MKKIVYLLPIQFIIEAPTHEAMVKEAKVIHEKVQALGWSFLTGIIEQKLIEKIYDVDAN